MSNYVELKSRLLLWAVRGRKLCKDQSFLGSVLTSYRMTPLIKAFQTFSLLLKDQKCFWALLWQGVITTSTPVCQFATTIIYFYLRIAHWPKYSICVAFWNRSRLTPGCWVLIHKRISLLYFERVESTHWVNILSNILLWWHFLSQVLSASVVTERGEPTTAGSGIWYFPFTHFVGCDCYKKKKLCSFLSYKTACPQAKHRQKSNHKSLLEAAPICSPPSLFK